MLVSTKGRYALRMMIDIARNSDHGPVSLREIGERQGVSAKYLEQLARLLYSAGLLVGSRGQGGGYSLAKPAAEILAGDIIRATEGTVAPVACLARTDTVCPRACYCETNRFWTGLDRVITEYVDSYTLEDLVQMQDSDEVVPGPCLSYSPTIAPHA
ncbi:MAG: Rrf2 family transcriptional regulator [Coriobacteriales bacterium]|jgi:Rrf2 family protein